MNHIFIDKMPGKTGDLAGIAPAPTMLELPYEGKKVIAWRVNDPSSDQTRVYLSSGEVWVGTWPELRARIPLFDRFTDFEPHPNNPPVPLHPAYRKLFRELELDSPLTEEQWKVYADWAFSPLSAYFVCGECEQTRLIEASQAQLLEEMLAEGYLSCEAVGVACGKSRDPQEIHSLSRLMLASRKRAGTADRGSKDDLGATQSVRQSQAWAKQIPWPLFYGEKDSPELDNWISLLERSFELKEVECDKLKRDLAVLSFRGQAKRWWERNSKTGAARDASTWKSLLDVLRREFQSPKERAKIWQRWKQLKQKGTVKDLQEEVAALRALCPLGGKAEFINIVTALQPEIADYVDAQRRLAKVEWVDEEQLFEWAYYGETATSHLVKRHPVGALSKPKATAAAANPQTGSKEGAMLYCFVCDEEGHYQADCAKAVTTGKCRRCGSDAHTVFRCPQRPQSLLSRARTAVASIQTWLEKIGLAPEDFSEEEEETSDKEEVAEDSTEKVEACALRVSCTKVTTADRRRIYFVLVAPGGKIQALFDPGADVTIIDGREAKKRGVQVKALPRRVIVENACEGADAEAVGYVPALPLAKGTWSEKRMALVVPAATAPLILGLDWFDDWLPQPSRTSRAFWLNGVSEPWWPLPRVSARVTWERLGVVTTAGAAALSAAPDPLEAVVVSAACAAAAWKERDRDRPWYLLALKESERTPPETVLEDDVRALLDEFSEVFEEPKGLPPPERSKHCINVPPEARPVSKVPYRLSEPQRQALREQIPALIEKGWIRPSKSPWGSVALLVPKKDGSLRLCIDYREVNALTRLEATPLPRIDVMLEKLGRANWFSKLDLNAGFHQIALSDDSIERSAFKLAEPICGAAHFEWVVMPFGLTNAPPTFQRVMYHEMSDCADVAEVYIFFFF